MLKQKYFLTGIFILSAERQPMKLAWRKIVWLPFLSTKVEVESTDYYASVLVKNSNPQLEDIKVAFNSFIENMKEKLE